MPGRTAVGHNACAKCFGCVTDTFQPLPNGTSIKTVKDQSGLLKTTIHITPDNMDDDAITNDVLKTNEVIIFRNTLNELCE